MLKKKSPFKKKKEPIFFLNIAISHELYSATMYTSLKIGYIIEEIDTILVEKSRMYERGRKDKGREVEKGDNTSPNFSAKTPFCELYSATARIMNAHN